MNVALARDFLQSLSSAVRSRALYPQRHPALEEKIDELHRATGAMLAEQSAFNLFIHQDSFFLEDKLLRRESLTLQGMMRQWEQLGVRSISIADSVTRADLESLVRFLSAEGPQPEGATSINTATLIAPEDRPLPGVEEFLRRAYGETLDLMRDMRGAITRGIAPPMGPAKQAVDRLVDAVLKDPESSILLTAMRSHDEPTFFHMINVCILSVATGATIGLSRPQLTALGIGGLLHDLGKITIPNEILTQTGPLSDEDWARIRRHPSEGATMILRSWDKLTPLAARIAYEHHRWIDGSGYPSPPIEVSPNLLSRIVSVADTFDAMTSRRPYRRADHRERALDVLLTGAGSHYDPRLVRVFIRMLGYFPPGSVVELDDGSTAVVVRNNAETLSLPVVKLVKNPAGEPIEPVTIDLKLPGGPPFTIIKGLPPEAAGVDVADLALT